MWFSNNLNGPYETHLSSNLLFIARDSHQLFHFIVVDSTLYKLMFVVMTTHSESFCYILTLFFMRYIFILHLFRFSYLCFSSYINTFVKSCIKVKSSTSTKEDTAMAMIDEKVHTHLRNQIFHGFV